MDRDIYLLEIHKQAGHTVGMRRREATMRFHLEHRGFTRSAADSGNQKCFVIPGVPYSRYFCTNRCL